MRTPFLERLHEGPMLGDGALGTMIYAEGVFINRCYDELNLSQAQLIARIHGEYVAAGAQVIETNTFGANSVLLQQYGLAEQTEEINRRGAELACEAVSDANVYVLGSMGPTGVINKPGRALTEQRVAEAFREQARALAAGGVSGIILETFYSLDELLLALETVRAAVDLPVVAQFSFDASKQAAVDSPRVRAEYVAQCLDDAGADVIGTNCGAGPAVLLKIVEAMASSTEKPISVYANAGVSREHHGRLLCLGTSAEYMAEYARRYAQAGARLIGGCCGTTPEMISEMAKFLKGVTAAQRSRALLKTQRAVEPRAEVPLAERSEFGAALAQRNGRRLVSVELSPPLGTNPAKLIDGARQLKQGGVDVVNIPDGPRAVPRMSPIASAKLVREEVGMDAIVHYCCRDRNLLGMQMDLLGSHALGLNNLMLITGDPPKIGNVQEATPVFDVDAIGLIQMVKNLNQGIGLGGSDIKSQTSFVIGAGCNPGAVDVDEEVQRFGAKAEAGAEFFFSQPVYLPELLNEFIERTKEYAGIPFFVGILPLASLRNAEFLNNEVPGMQIPEAILERMQAAHSKEAQQHEGIRIAREMLLEAVRHERVSGIYMFPPFGRYASVLDVLSVL